MGESTGDFNAQMLRDRAEEAPAALDFLRARDDIRPDRVGLWGHSQGGMVAPLAAALSDKVAFLIEVSGWQGPAWKQDQTRVEAEMCADGWADQEIMAASAFAKFRWTDPWNQTVRRSRQRQQKVKKSPWFEYIHLCDEPLFYSARRNIEQDTEPWWVNVHCPVLALFGDKDTSSGPPEPLVALIRRGLAKAGNTNLTVRISRTPIIRCVKREPAGARS